jgi:hypothetical protein
VNLIATISASELLLPTHALSDLRLVIELNSADQSLTCFGSPTAATYAIKDAFPNIGLVNLDPNTHNQIEQMSGNRYEWSSVLYRTFSRIHPAQQSRAVIPITASFSSARNMVVTMQEVANQENRSAYSCNDLIAAGCLIIECLLIPPMCHPKQSLS